MNWTNIAEDLGITLISFTVGVILGASVTSHIIDKVIKSNQTILIEAIHKNTTAIDNSYDIKNKKGDLNLKNVPKINNDTIQTNHGWLIFHKHNDKK